MDREIKVVVTLKVCGKFEGYCGSECEELKHDVSYESPKGMCKRYKKRLPLTWRGYKRCKPCLEAEAAYRALVGYRLS